MHRSTSQGNILVMRYVVVLCIRDIPILEIMHARDGEPSSSLPRLFVYVYREDHINMDEQEHLLKILQLHGTLTAESTSNRAQ